MSKCLLHAGVVVRSLCEYQLLRPCFGDSAHHAESAAAVSASPSKNRISPFVQQLQQICPSTVNITPHGEAAEAGDVMLGTLSPSKGSRVNGMGTGIILDERGYIVNEPPRRAGRGIVTMTLWNKESYDAQVVRSDKQNDPAIIKITPRTPLPVAPLDVVRPDPGRRRLRHRQRLRLGALRHPRDHQPPPSGTWKSTKSRRTRT